MTIKPPDTTHENTGKQLVLQKIYVNVINHFEPLVFFRTIRVHFDGLLCGGDGRIRTAE